MKILGILGSPRKNANSTLLAREVLAAAQAGGADVEEVVLNGLTYSGCTACGACKGTFDACVLKDDLQPVLESLLAADAVVFASPVYFGDVSGQFKCFFDRTYSFLGTDYKTRVPGNKTSILILTQGDPEEDHFADIATRYEDWIVQWFGFAANETIRGVGLGDAGAVNANADLMARAREAGAKLV